MDNLGKITLWSAVVSKVASDCFKGLPSWKSRIEGEPIEAKGAFLAEVFSLPLEEFLTNTEKSPDNVDSHRWDTPGSLRASLLRLDGQVSALTNAEKRVVDPAVVTGEVAGQLEQITQRMGLGAGDGAVKPSSRALVFESVKPGFTREAGSIRLWVSDR